MSFTMPPPNAITHAGAVGAALHHLFGQFLHRRKALVALRRRAGKALRARRRQSASPSAAPRCRQTVLLGHNENLARFRWNVPRRSCDYAAFYDSVVRALGRFDAKSWHTPLLTCVITGALAPRSSRRAFGPPTVQLGRATTTGALFGCLLSCNRAFIAGHRLIGDAFLHEHQPARLASNSTRAGRCPRSCPVAIRFETGCTTSRSIARFRWRAP